MRIGVLYSRIRLEEDRIPDVPTEQQLRLRFRSTWGLELTHDRDWHVFHQDGHSATLRMVRDGSLVAQCNMAPVQQTDPGQHTPLKQFEADIRDRLGDKAAGIDAGTTVQTTPVFVHRFRVHGGSDGLPMHWVYYLCADPSGRQSSLVFSLGQDDLKRLGDADSRMVRTIRFLRPTRVTAEKR